MAHHLIYKRETDVPKLLQRKLNRLVGLFETADEQFSSIKNERKNYLSKFNQNHTYLLDESLNLDTLVNYANWKFPTKKIDEFGFSTTISILIKDNYMRIIDIDNIVNNSSAVMKDYEERKRENYVEYSLPFINLSIACHDKNFFENHPGGWGEIATELIEKHKLWK